MRSAMSSPPAPSAFEKKSFGGISGSSSHCASNAG